MPSNAVQEWLDKAVEDEQVIDLIVKANGPWNMAAYHIQQAAEKYLKAALVASGVAPPRTHDLVQLLSLIPGTPASQIVQKAATMITSFAWLTRYPGASKIDATHISDGNVNLEEIKRWVDSSIASRGP